VARAAARAQAWFERGPPAEFWLPGFFFAQSFLTAALQDFARCARVPVDAVDFEVIPLASAPAAGAAAAGGPQGPAGPGEGVVVHGLFLEGARWDEAAMRLAESAPRVRRSGRPAPAWTACAQPRRRRMHARAVHAGRRHLRGGLPTA
jgi:dynein heavy chain